MEFRSNKLIALQVKTISGGSEQLEHRTLHQFKEMV